jgi:hypothetical protein
MRRATTFVDRRCSEDAFDDDLQELSDAPTAHWGAINAFLDEHRGRTGPTQDVALALEMCAGSDGSHVRARPPERRLSFDESRGAYRRSLMFRRCACGPARAAAAVAPSAPAQPV